MTMIAREIQVVSVRDAFTIQNILFSSRTADAYRAIDLEYQVSVTLWLSKGEFNRADTTAQAFLNRIAFLAKQVPPILDVQGYGMDQHGVAFASMPLLDGSVAVAPLRDLAEIERRFTRISRLVDRMHSLGIVSSEICGTSFWINRSGDLSLVNAMGSEHGVVREDQNSMPDEIMPFVAPELFTGAVPSVAVDIYSLGAILFFMLFGDLSPILSRDSQGKITIPERSIGGEVPVWAAEIVSVALDESPQVRYPTVSAMLQALGEAKKRTSLTDNLPAKKTLYLPSQAQPRLLVRNKQKIEEPEQSVEAERTNQNRRFSIRALLSVFGVFALVVGGILFTLSVRFEKEEEPKKRTTDLLPHQKVTTDKSLKEAIQGVQQNAEQVVDDLEKIKSLITSRDPIAHDTLVRLSLGASNLELRRKVESAIIERARKLGSIRAAEEVRLWLQTIGEQKTTVYETVLRALDTTLPQDAREKYIRQLYTTIPSLALKLTAALGFDAKDLNIYKQLFSQLVGDSLKLDNAQEHSAAALVLAEPLTSQTYSDDVIQNLSSLTDSDITWLLDILAERRDPNIKVIAHAAIDRDIVGSGKKIFATILRDREDIPAQLSVALVNAVSGLTTTADVAQFGNWIDLQSPSTLLGVMASTEDTAVITEAFDTVASKIKRTELVGQLIDRVRNYQWERRGDYARLIGVAAFSAEFTESDLQAILEKHRTRISEDSKFLGILLEVTEPKLQLALMKSFPDQLGAGRLINLLSSEQSAVKLLAIEHLKQYNQVQLLQLILEAFRKERDETVKNAYREAFWFIREREGNT